MYAWPKHIHVLHPHVWKEVETDLLRSSVRNKAEQILGYATAYLAYPVDPPLSTGVHVSKILYVYNFIKRESMMVYHPQTCLALKI
jgi:hypothetical protein